MGKKLNLDRKIIRKFNGSTKNVKTKQKKIKRVNNFWDENKGKKAHKPFFFFGIKGTTLVICVP